LYSPLQLAETTLLATQIASAIAAVLLVLPMYVTGRMLFGRSAAFAGTLLFQVLPVPAHLTSDGLTEGLYLLGMGTSLMLAVRAMRKPGVGGFLLTGLAIGSSYLVRPEAMMAAAGFGLVAAYLGITRKWPRDLTLGRLAALGVGVMLVAGPYMLVIGGVSNKPTANQMLEENPKEKLWKGQANGVAGGPLFAKWMNPPVEGLPSRVLWGAGATGIETFKSLHYLPAAFALAAFVFFRRRIATEPAFWVLLAVAAINAAVLVYLGAKVGYVSERHTVLLVMIGCIFAGGALEPVTLSLGRLPMVGGFWAGKFGVPALLVILVGMALPSALKPLHANREGFKHAGIWLAGHVEKDDCVIDPFCWSDWYSGRTLYFIPKDPVGEPAVTYAIVDDKLRSDDHERLPRMDAAKNVMNDGRSAVVYWWPETVPQEAAKVKVYKLVRK
jgi:4-amino-4-deoxy-L-arabinose transferase-like glycosyltransferase